MTGTSTLSWTNDLICVDQGNGFEVRISAAALAEMRAEARRVDRTHGSRVETGGMLLGAVDEAAGVIHVDVAAGPPPDSRLSEVHFEHGRVGTQAVVDHHGDRTGGRTGYVGLWHTHPYGLARPSSTDMASLATLTTGPGTGRWALMVIVGGPGPRWEQWRDDGRPPAIYVHAVHRDHRTTSTSRAAQLPTPRPRRGRQPQVATMRRRARTSPAGLTPVPAATASRGPARTDDTRRAGRRGGGVGGRDGDRPADRPGPVRRRLPGDSVRAGLPARAARPRPARPRSRWSQGSAAAACWPRCGPMGRRRSRSSTTPSPRRCATTCSTSCSAAPFDRCTCCAGRRRRARRAARRARTSPRTIVHPHRAARAGDRRA